MTGQRSITLDVKLYAALLRLEGAATAMVSASTASTLEAARPALRAALDDLQKMRT